VSTIDLLQFHWWNFEHSGYLDAMRELARLRQEGVNRRARRHQFRQPINLRLLVKHASRSSPTRSASRARPPGSERMSEFA